MDSESNNELTLNATQKARIERNRLKALTLKESKLLPHPTSKIEAVESGVLRVAGGVWRDSGGGFLVDLVEDEAPAPRPVVTSAPAPLVHVADQPACLECGARFPASYLFDTFDYSVCDNCRDNDDKHSLITRTEAKNEYLLKDCDLDSRPPPLKFVMRKNPHNARWGSMRLYLHVQVEERALLVWGSEHELLEERGRRGERREKTRATRYGRELAGLRRGVRGVKVHAPHEHQFLEEHVEGDTYRARCQLCGHATTFEKM